MRLKLLEEIKNKLNEIGITDIYDSMSTDQHNLVDKIDNVEIHAVYNYGYVDIIGLTTNEFIVLQMLLNE